MIGCTRQSVNKLLGPVHRRRADPARPRRHRGPDLDGARRAARRRPRRARDLDRTGRVFARARRRCQACRTARGGRGRDERRPEPALRAAEERQPALAVRPDREDDDDRDRGIVAAGPPARPGRRRCRRRRGRSGPVPRALRSSRAPGRRTRPRSPAARPCRDGGSPPARPRRSVSASRSHGTSPKSAATLPPVATSTTEHVQPRSASAAPIASLQVISSSAQTWSREKVSDAVQRRRDELAPAPSPRARDPDVDGLGPGVRRDDRVRRPEQRFARAGRRPADSPIPASRSVRLAIVRAGAAVAESRQHLRLPDRAHLARRAGQGDDDPAVRSVDQPGGRGPVAVRQRLGRRDEPGLLEVHLRDMAMPRRDQSSRSQASRSGIDGRGPRPATAAIASRVRSSGVGPSPPVDTTRSARPSAVANASRDRVEVVGEGLDPAPAATPAR